MLRGEFKCQSQPIVCYNTVGWPKTLINHKELFCKITLRRIFQNKKPVFWIKETLRKKLMIRKIWLCTTCKIFCKSCNKNLSSTKQFFRFNYNFIFASQAMVLPKIVVCLFVYNESSLEQKHSLFLYKLI